MLHAYCIFDDFPTDCIHAFQKAGIALTVHPVGVPRPSSLEIKDIFEKNDIVIIGTSQKMEEAVFANIAAPKIIGTASVGTDHIHVPENKKELVTVLNTPTANARSVMEYTFGAALACKKRLIEGCRLFESGKNNKQLRQKPEDLYGSVLGVVGAGNIAREIIKFAHLFGMTVLCHTAHPENHRDLSENYQVTFTSLPELAAASDIISVNLPSETATQNYISHDIIQLMKDRAVFISIARKEVTDIPALLKKAAACPDFYVCLDIDVSPCLAQDYSLCDNIMLTPHIAGGTYETRKRMFHEITENILKHLNGQLL